MPYDQNKYRKEHLAEYAQYQQQSRERNPRSHLVIDARARGKRNGVPVNITVEDIDWVTHCPVLGIELVYARTGGKGQRVNSATLDRKINALGYVPGNVFVLSHRANRLKQDATVEEVEALLKYMKT
jgi:hypothetical protein